MERNYDLCSGRDHRGKLWYTRLPAGIAKTGMFVRLVGGIFLLVERVESGGCAAGNVPVCTAVELLESVWGSKGRV